MTSALGVTPAVLGELQHPLPSQSARIPPSPRPDPPLTLCENRSCPVCVNLRLPFPLQSHPTFADPAPSTRINRPSPSQRNRRSPLCAICGCSSTLLAPFRHCGYNQRSDTHGAVPPGSAGQSGDDHSISVVRKRAERYPDSHPCLIEGGLQPRIHADIGTAIYAKFLGEFSVLWITSGLG
jgi:hypothetical protein